jgi:NADPH2:quinone reductase
VVDREIDLGSAITSADAFEEHLGLGAEQYEDVDARGGRHQPTHLVEHATAIAWVGKEFGERCRPEHGEVCDHEQVGVSRCQQFRSTAEKGELRVERGRWAGLAGVVVVEERADRHGIEQQSSAEAFGNRAGGGALADAGRPVDRHDGHRDDDTAHFVRCAHREYLGAMRIWRLHELGDPAEQLRLVDEDAPSPGPGEVLIDVEAVGLAFPDVLQCRGQYQVKTGPGHTPGGESCGTVAALGDGVTAVEVGQRVAFLGSGGLAEQVTHPAAGVFVVPDGVSAETAAAIPINYCTTLYALHDRAHLQAGETVLITGAAGGTGTAAIQLAKAAGARTIAIAGGQTKVDLVRDLGADVVIDHRETPDWVDAVREASGGGVDVAYDPVGGDTFHQVRRCMGWDSRLLVIGFVAGIPEVKTNHALLKSYSIVGVHWGASLAKFPESLGQQMTTLLGMAAEGTVDPPLYPPYAFEDAATALQDLADRKTHGKVVVTL